MLKLEFVAIPTWKLNWPLVCARVVGRVSVPHAFDASLASDETSLAARIERLLTFCFVLRVRSAMRASGVAGGLLIGNIAVTATANWSLITPDAKSSAGTADHEGPSEACPTDWTRNKCANSGHT